MDAIETQEVGTLRVSLYLDEDGDMNPRTEYDNAGHMVCFHNRYRLGDKQTLYNESDFGSWDELEAAILEDNPGGIVLPLYLYDHGIVRMKVGSFAGLLPQGHAEFDSGMVGFIYISAEEIQHEWGGDPNPMGKARTYLEGEVENYDAYLRGDVVGWMVEDPKTGEVLESCWGYLNAQEYAMQEGVAAAKFILKERQKELDEKIAETNGGTE